MLILALALSAAPNHFSDPRRKVPSLACTQYPSGREAPGRIYRGQIEVREGRRWLVLAPRQIEWSCVPADGRRYPIDPD